ncbi:MAG: helix-turn-helix domain-containing protein [Nitrospiraceae bacterium]
MRQPQLSSNSDNGWHHVSSHGTVLFCIAANQDCTISDLSETLFLTRHTVWGIVGDLRRAGMLHIRKNGRRHHYSVNLDAPFRHPVLQGITLRQVLGELVRMGRRVRRE